jgi:hypothetical protein
MPPGSHRQSSRGARWRVTGAPRARYSVRVEAARWARLTATMARAETANPGTSS